MHKLLLFLPAAAAGLLLSGCADDPYYGHVAYERSGPAYYGGAGYGPGYDEVDYGGDYGPDVDFYYVGGRPYSREYGPLVYRENNYYYSRGGQTYGYDRGGGSRGGSSRYAGSYSRGSRSYNDGQSGRYSGRSTQTYNAGAYQRGYGGPGTVQQRSYSGATYGGATYGAGQQRTYSGGRQYRTGQQYVGAQQYGGGQQRAYGQSQTRGQQQQQPQRGGRRAPDKRDEH